MNEIREPSNSANLRLAKTESLYSDASSLENQKIQESVAPLCSLVNN